MITSNEFLFGVAASGTVVAMRDLLTAVTVAGGETELLDPSPVGDGHGFRLVNECNVINYLQNELAKMRVSQTDA